MRQLNRQVSADLETIAHKCLQKDPAKRYATAQELADDLGRYLHGEPIVARPVGTLERVAKWVGRNRVVAALLATVAMAILAGTGLSAWFAYQSNKEAITARNAEREADEQRGQAIDNAKEARDALHAGPSRVRPVPGSLD
ncbi:MAG: hypothetical protein U0840_10430 [Gemmataceae bacterium]